MVKQALSAKILTRRGRGIILALAIPLTSSSGMVLSQGRGRAPDPVLLYLRNFPAYSIYAAPLFLVRISASKFLSAGENMRIATTMFRSAAGVTFFASVLRF